MNRHERREAVRLLASQHGVYCDFLTGCLMLHLEVNCACIRAEAAMHACALCMQMTAAVSTFFVGVYTVWLAACHDSRLRTLMTMLHAWCLQRKRTILQWRKELMARLDVSA